MLMRRIAQIMAAILAASALFFAIPLTVAQATGQDCAVYRLYNPNNGDHHYTTDSNEYATLASYGWKQEGVAWTSPESSNTPVYRLYNPSSGDHHYTKDANEYKTLASYGWKQEGIAWYSDDSQSVAIYRLYNPNATIGTHHYTMDSNEYATLKTLGWKQEGVAWYAIDTTSTAKTPIMGASTTTVSQMVSYYKSTGSTYPSPVYTQYGASTIEQFCTILMEEANSEGVRAEVLFAQVMVETGNLQFGGSVKAAQCNFGGLGALDGGGSGADFSSHGSDGVRMGLRAQAQHLKAYASTAELNSTCVDPRFKYITRGCAPLVEDLGSGKWASDPAYASKLLRVMSLLAQK